RSGSPRLPPRLAARLHRCARSPPAILQPAPARLRPRLITNVAALADVPASFARENARIRIREIEERHGSPRALRTAGGFGAPFRGSRRCPGFVRAGKRATTNTRNTGAARVTRAAPNAGRVAQQ